MTLYIAESDLPQFEHIQSVRPTDGARLVASRVLVDERTPVRRTIVLQDRMENFIFDELQLFEDAHGNVQKQYATSQLLDLARKADFVDWQQLPVALVEGWELAGGEYRKRLLPTYQDPDPTPHPVD